MIKFNDQSEKNFLRIWSHLLKKSIMENLFFWAVCQVTAQTTVKRHENENKNKDQPTDNHGK